MKNLLVIGGSYFVVTVSVEEPTAMSTHELNILNRGHVPLALQGVHEITCYRRDQDPTQDDRGGNHD